MGTTMEAASAAEEEVATSHEKIFVSVRVRPLNEKEILNKDVSDWECISDNSVYYKNATLSASERSMYPTTYTFDKVFGKGCSTRQVYEKGAKEVALSAVKGINSSVFAYGQTSSGKTYTMTGITEYTIQDIYEYIHKHTERDFLLKFSAMEIYNESVRDLLTSDTTPLRLLDDPERGTVVEKLIEETVRDRNHMIELLTICEAQRQIGETFLNEASSRSHQIIRLTIESSAREYLGKDNSSILTATVDFVDLAGSERASQSLSAGTRLKEGCHINRSLLTLGTVIRKLSKGRGGHIPFRDSKLTRILQPSLGGNARTAVICTMSPARIHVEQSRNTLLFASCAKEVTINAQVNVVMSDKALVKHLQRELARLENESRNPLSSSETAEYASLLQQKDIQIEKLEKEVKDLIIQRDIAQSQLKELLQVFGDDADSLLKEGLGHYPSLHVQDSPKSRDNSISEPHDQFNSPAIHVREYSGEHSTSSSEDQYVKVQNFNENFPQNHTPARVVLETSTYSESDSCQEWDEMEKLSNGTSEDLCKEVRCIEAEDYSSNNPVEPIYLYPDENIQFPELTVLGSGDETDQELTEETELLTILPFKEDQEIVSGSESLIMEKEDISSEEKPGPVFTKPLLESRSKILTKSRSCEGRLVTDLFSSSFDTVQDFVAEPENCREKCLMVPRIVPGKVSHGPTESIVDIKLEIQNEKTSTYENAESIIDSCYAEKNEKVELQQDKEVTDSPISEKEQMEKNVKDVGLDPIEEEFKSISNWPVEFERLQREIIKLWDTCHVSLVHRTYFFLLFQGDSTDAIYMEVELRRLIFLRDTFAREDNTVVRGRTLSLASSIKDLRQERQKLSSKMMKKLTEQERESLYLKWGIGLNTKLRRLQLAHRLWTDTEDFYHINDSAYLIAKLVGFLKPGQAPKEMFSLDFSPRFETRTYSFKRSLLSLRF